MVPCPEDAEAVVLTISGGGCEVVNLHHDLKTAAQLSPTVEPLVGDRQHWEGRLGWWWEAGDIGMGGQVVRETRVLVTGAVSVCLAAVVGWRGPDPHAADARVSVCGRVLGVWRGAGAADAAAAAAGAPAGAAAGAAAGAGRARRVGRAGRARDAAAGGAGRRPAGGGRL